MYVQVKYDCSMSTTLTIRINDNIKRDAQKFAKATGLSLSTIIENQLQAVVARGRIIFESPEPLGAPDDMLEVIRQAKKDVESGVIKKLPVYRTGVEIREHFKPMM